MSAITSDIARFVAGLRHDDIPTEVRERARMVILDHVGIALRARQEADLSPVMAAGLRPNLSWNPLEDMTTVTVRIVDALVGDHAFDSPDTLSAFALGLVLFVVTLLLNVISLRLIRKFKEKYEINTL